MKKTVLVIDDDPVFTRLVSTLLTSRCGANSLSASNGKEALGHIDRAADYISLIVCDLNMPDHDGVEFILELGKRHVQTPILLVSGAVPPVIKAAETLAGIHGLNVLNLLIKPVHFRQLALTFDKALAA